MQEYFQTFIRRIGYLFSTPGKIFTEISEHSAAKDAILPIVLVILMTIGMFLSAQPAFRKAQEQQIMKNPQVTEENMAQAMKTLDNPVVKVVSIVSMTVTPIITLFITAGLMMAWGNFGGGGRAPWAAVLASSAYVQTVDIFAILLKTPLMITQKTVEIQTSLALFVGDQVSKDALFRMASQIDLFRIWKFVLWYLVFLLVFKFNKGKSVVWSVLPFIIVCIAGYFFSGLGK